MLSWFRNTGNNNKGGQAPVSNPPLAYFSGENLADWIRHFHFSEELHATLLSFGAKCVDDLQQVYNDVQFLESLQKQIPAAEYDRFIAVKDLTSSAPSTTAPGSGNSLPTAIDVKNLNNSVDRWTNAFNLYLQESTEARNNRTSERIVINAVIDISGSMEGAKLIAVKLGLCALIAHLQDNDMMNITTFSEHTRSITNGFRSIHALKQVLPQLLSRVRDDGSTAFFDAVIEGVRLLRTQVNCSPPTFSSIFNLGKSSQPPSQAELAQKAILIALTDGEDNASRYTAPMVFYRLTNPGINHFMFILVAVAMNRKEEEIFRPWMDLRHCKQISVDIRTGTRLVQIFREVLVHRVLLTEVSHSRFYQTTEAPSSSNDSNNNTATTGGTPATPTTATTLVTVPPNGTTAQFDAEDDQLIGMFPASSGHRNNNSHASALAMVSIRPDLLRAANNNNNNNGNAQQGDEEEDDYNSYSPAVSRCNSVSDFHRGGSPIFDDIMIADNNSNNSYPGSPMAHSPIFMDQMDDTTTDDAVNAMARTHSPLLLQPAALPAYSPGRNSPPYRPASPIFYRSNDDFITFDDLLAQANGLPLPTANTSTAVAGNRVLVVDEIDNEGRLFLPHPPPIPEEQEGEGEEDDDLDLSKFPKECFCPITHVIMRDPVVCSDGHTYEKTAIEAWFLNHHSSPVTNLPLSNLQLIPNYSLRNIIQDLKASAKKNNVTTVTASPAKDSANDATTSEQK